MEKRRGKLTSQFKLCLELAWLAGTEQETIEPDRLQFLRLAADYCSGKPPLKRIESYCKKANGSQSFYTPISVKQWLRTVIKSNKPIYWGVQRKADLKIYSNVVPQQVYLKRLEVVMATCLGHECNGGFFPISDLREGAEPPRQSCTNCALAEHLRVETDRMAVDELEKSLKLWQFMEGDVKTGRVIHESGGDGDVSEISWRSAIFVRKRFHVNGPCFKRELKVAETVSHPNIVHCFARSCIGSTYCDLFMEFLEEDLESFLSDKARLDDDDSARPPLQDSVDVLLQIAEAMRHLHEKSFVHGDLKPGNILVSKLAMPHSDVQFYLIKVADFGRAQLVDSSGKTVKDFDSAVGTRFYTAPEVLRCRYGGASPEHPQKIDVYSFGVVAYQVLTGVTTSRLYADFPCSKKKYTEGVMRPETDGLQWRPNRIWNENSQTPERVHLAHDRSSLLPLIERCWASSPEARPTFSEICCEIQNLY